MTNFEKWKNGLKPEELIVDNGENIDKDMCRHTVGIECTNCPVKKNGSCSRDYWTECGEAFLKWANEECTDKNGE